MIDQNFFAQQTHKSAMTLSKPQLEQLLEKEKKQLFDKYWSPIANVPWKTIEHRKYHRTLPNAVLDIGMMKTEIAAKLGYFASYVFLNHFIGTQDWKGPYCNIDKVIAYLYHLISGKSYQKMNKYIPTSTFRDFAHELIDKNYDALTIWIDNMLSNNFSTLNICMLSAKLYNPIDMASITMYMDGYDSRVNYNSVYDVDYKYMFSFKLKASEYRNQCIQDVNLFWLYISMAQGCETGNDGTMFVECQPDQKMATIDILQMDGGYTLFVDKLFENPNCSLHMSAKNFVTPIRKIAEVDFELGETQYNQKFGAKRSAIETGFATILNTYTKFSKHKVYQARSGQA